MRGFARARIPAVWQALALFLMLFGSAHASAPAPDNSTARYEVDFMEDMIDHHAMAIMMASMCEQKAVHTDLRELCTDIRLAQRQEIETMQSWLQSWYGTTYAPDMTPGDRRKMEKLSQLSGAEFEIEFMQSMIRHHRTAIKSASTCLDRAYHGSLVSLCENIIDAQLMEIRMMQAWLCDWYEICRKTHDV
jgi:uncharacterized protein (DUF305 family)